MIVEDAWTVEIGTPIKLLDNRFGRLIKIDMENLNFLIDIYKVNEVVETRELPFEAVEYYKKTKALIEVKVKNV